MKKISFVIVFLIIFCSYSYAYSDIKANYWAYKAIEGLSKDKILIGYPEGDFRPNNKMTKAEFITAFIKIIEPNADVSSGLEHWAYGYINLASEKGILDFLDYSEFNPDEYITRWEICKMIVNSFDSTKSAKLKNNIYRFTDIDKLNAEEMRVAGILSECGVLNGYPDGTVRFNECSTRSEVSCFLYSVKEKIDKLKSYDKSIVYEGNRAVSSIFDDDIVLKKYEFAEDNEYCTTIISSIDFFKFDEADKSQYKDIFNRICNEEHPYFKYRNKFGKDNYVVAIEFKTKNNTLEYDILTGYSFLHIGFDERINVIDAFDTCEITCQVENKPYNGVVVKPGETQDTSAFYIVDKLPEDKFYINRSITTLYDSKNMKNINVSSFHSAVILL